MRYLFLLLLVLTPTMVFAGGDGQRGADQPKLDALANPVLLTPVVSNKRFDPRGAHEYIWFDVTWDTTKLPKPTRRVKGFFLITDLFGAVKVIFDWVIAKPMVPGTALTEGGIGFEFNQYRAPHMWVFATDLKDMVITFTVTGILYQDGTRVIR